MTTRSKQVFLALAGAISLAPGLAPASTAMAQAPAPAAPSATSPPAATTTLQNKAPSASAADLEFWASVKDSRNPAELRAYLSAYPAGAFASLARVRLQALKAAAATPKAPPAPQPAPSRSAAAPLAGASALTTPEIIREVQNKLYNLNYIIPNQTGRLDAKTRTAIRRWQFNLKRQETGDLSDTELAMLRAVKVPTTWATIGYTVGGGTSSHWNVSSRARSEELARQGCRRLKGGNCKVVTAALRGCLAISHSTGIVGRTRYHSAFGIGRPTLAEATDVALTECRARARVPKNCGIRATTCADGSHKK